ncbi:hypothetical protein F5887DRAFT_917157 [Amanita rubescens]|nr:hypothetical protein F5887DRAFT_917157 [Amanita rubescens]
MRLSIISILLVFVSAVWALPSLARHNNDIQSIFKRADPTTIAELKIRLGGLAVSWADVNMLWDHQRGIKIGGTKSYPSYRMTDQYNGEDAIIGGIFPYGKLEKEIIQEVMRLRRVGRLRAFAENLDAMSDRHRTYPQREELDKDYLESAAGPTFLDDLLEEDFWELFERYLARYSVEKSKLQNFNY